MIIKNLIRKLFIQISYSFVYSIIISFLAWSLSKLFFSYDLDFRLVFKWSLLILFLFTFFSDIIMAILLTKLVEEFKKEKELGKINLEAFYVAYEKSKCKVPVNLARKLVLQGRSYLSK